MNGLRERRIAKGMSQKELGDRVGVSQAVISILETYDIYPRGQIMDDLCIALEHNFRDNTYNERSVTKMNQKHRVLEYIQKHGSISQQEAIREFSCYRLSAKIFELRREGYPITTLRVPFSNEYTSGHYAVYRLAE